VKNGAKKLHPGVSSIRLVSYICRDDARGATQTCPCRPHLHRCQVLKLSSLAATASSSTSVFAKQQFSFLLPPTASLATPTKPPLIETLLHGPDRIQPVFRLFPLHSARTLDSLFTPFLTNAVPTTYLEIGNVMIRPGFWKSNVTLTHIFQPPHPEEPTELTGKDARPQFGSRHRDHVNCKCLQRWPSCPG
jgi:hypothetical protein